MAERPIMDRNPIVVNPRDDGRESNERINIPNAITLGGYASSLWWLAGGSPWFAVASIAADEADGRVARATGESTEYGSHLDWGVDMALAGAIAVKVGLGGMGLVVLPIMMAVQVAMRERGETPPVGSGRAAMTVYALLARGFVPF